MPPKPGCGPGQPSFRPVGFVHVNKAGGTAMRAVLFRHAAHQMLERIAPPNAAVFLRSKRARWFHASASLQQQAVGAKQWEASYTFALVRNPYARQVSMFHFLLGEVSCQRPIGVRPQHCEQRKLPAPGAWLQDPQLSKLRFRQWLTDMRAAFPPGTKDAHLFGSRSHGNEADVRAGVDHTLEGTLALALALALTLTLTLILTLILTLTPTLTMTPTLTPTPTLTLTLTLTRRSSGSTVWSSISCMA